MCDQICVYNWDIRGKVHLEEIVFPFSDKTDIYYRNIFLFLHLRNQVETHFLSDRTIPDNSIQASDCVEIQYLCYWEKKKLCDASVELLCVLQHFVVKEVSVVKEFLNSYICWRFDVEFLYIINVHDWIVFKKKTACCLTKFSVNLDKNQKGNLNSVIYGWNILKFGEN